jgi:hypothetical protein
MKKIYVGITVQAEREVFKSETEPTWETTPQYAAVIGEFKTMRGAKFMAEHGQGNPHLQCVDDAERIAKQYSK